MNTSRKGSSGEEMGIARKDAPNCMEPDGEKKSAREGSSSRVRALTATALLTALICILGPLSIPLPFSPVPISFANLAICLTAMLIGWKKGTLACLLYLLLGFAGVPVFSSFTAGPGKLLGPTGGYLIGYLFLSLTAGFFAELANRNKTRSMRTAICIIGMAAGHLILYLFGTVWLTSQAGMTFSAALWAGVIPFLPGDAVKIILAVIVGGTLRERLQKAGLLP